VSFDQQSSTLGDVPLEKQVRTVIPPSLSKGYLEASSKATS